MNSAAWTWFAIAYQSGFAYAIALMIYQIGGVFAGNINVIGLVAAIVYIQLNPKYQAVEAAPAAAAAASASDMDDELD